MTDKNGGEIRRKAKYANGGQILAVDGKNCNSFKQNRKHECVRKNLPLQKYHRFRILLLQRQNMLWI
jgi:hypothetical protein